VRSIRYRGPLFKRWLAAFTVAFVILGYLGIQPTSVWGIMPTGIPLLGGAPVATIVAQICTLIYFAFFLAMPVYTSRDTYKPVPERVTA
jgi:ubiquinol-cytochrome c reductase cytochrome b subunit